MSDYAETPYSRDYYFDSYAYHEVHELMLKDNVRTSTYRNAIYYNKHLFKNKIVLDVGCGTGILSMFAAKAGARHVFGVDCSDVALHAASIVKENQLDGVITIIHGKLEDINLPVSKVDIIISEWMGHCLFYERMLETILFARDKWLVPNGLLLPDKCDLFITGIEDETRLDKLDFWTDVQGFDMSPASELIVNDAVIERIDGSEVVTDHCHLITVDLNTVTKVQLNFSVPFQLTARRDNNPLHGLMTYFTVQFTKGKKRIWFSTAPEAPDTHWKQTLFHLKNGVVVRMGEQINGQFAMKEHSKSFGDLVFDIEFDFKGEFGDLYEKNEYFMHY